MKKDFSPEERLLRLIKSSKKKESPKEPPEEQKPKETPKATPPEKPQATPQPPVPEPPKQQTPQAEPPEPPKKEEPFADIPYVSKVPPLAQRAPSAPAMAAPEVAQAGAKAKRLPLSFSFTLQELNIGILGTILVAILAITLIYFVYDIFFSTYPDVVVDVAGESASDTGEMAGQKGGAEKKPFSFYSSEIKGRNIFRPQQVEVSHVPTGPTVEEVSASLSLIGIIAGDRPQAIIEHKKSGKSYFLYEGGTVENCKILEVREDSVLLDYQGQNFELVL